MPNKFSICHGVLTHEHHESVKNKLLKNAFFNKNKVSLVKELNVLKRFKDANPYLSEKQLLEFARLLTPTVYKAVRNKSFMNSFIIDIQ